MIPIIGDKDVVRFKDPLGRQGHMHRWWAERGRIHWEDQVSGDYGSISVRDALYRLQANQDLIRNSRKADGYMHHEQITELQSYIDNMIPLIAKAQQQGMPDDKKHSRQMADDWKAKRHSRLVVVPGLRSF